MLLYDTILFVDDIIERFLSVSILHILFSQVQHFNNMILYLTLYDQMLSY